jgi:hypothetical protein
MPFVGEETMKISGWDSNHNVNHLKTKPSWPSGIPRT